MLMKEFRRKLNTYRSEQLYERFGSVEFSVQKNIQFLIK